MRGASLKSWFDKNHVKYDLIHSDVRLAIIVKSKYKKEVLKHLNSLNKVNYWEYIVDGSLIQIYLK